MVKKDEIISKVKAIMNEIGEEETNSSLLDEDTIKIDQYIESCIGDALAMIVLKSAIPVNPKKGTSNPVNNNDGTGYIVLPDDFLKLIAFKMEGWKRTVSEAFPLDSEKAKQQSNEYTRGGNNKPVCVLSYSPEGKKVLEYYSVTGSNHTVSVFVYEASYEPSSGINMKSSDAVFYALCYMTAGLVYSIFENQATAEEMQKIAINYINDAVSH